MAPSRRELPSFVEPMLASSRGPFDSDEHLFEIKWDGFRCLAFVEGGSVRLVSRNRVDLTRRFAALEGLRGLPDGTLLDGEVVLLVDGKPDFEGLLGLREGRREAPGVELVYFAFDLLVAEFETCLDEPLRERRARLEDLLERFPATPRLALSEGVVGEGRALFDEAGAKGLEGIVAKRLDSPYRPGERTDEWCKIKHRKRLHGLVLGWVPDGRDVKSLIIASDLGEGLACVGKVGSGLNAEHHRVLRELCAAHEVDEPLVPCPIEGRWLEPIAYAVVDYAETTRAGHLRAPVLRELIVEGSPS